jgi:predicted transposase/invertase (TIGR01784 family)
MVRKKLGDLNLLDDFLFNAMVSHGKDGERFCRKLLKIIFGREFWKLTVIPQKVYYGTDTDKHGARLDVYLNDDATCVEAENGTIYDIEPDKNSNSASVTALPRRIRFYHAVIDGRSFQSGADYDSLKNVITIMITPFDPFGKDRMVYTIRNMCEEDPTVPYDDGVRSLFLYTKGKIGIKNEALRQLLNYMEKTNEQNAVNEDLKELQGMVEKVKDDREVSLEFMKSYEREKYIFEQGEKAERKRSEEAIKNATKEVADATKRAEDATKRAEDVTKAAEEKINRNFVETVENVTKNFHVSIQEACEKLGRSYEDYLQIKES